MDPINIAIVYDPCKNSYPLVFILRLIASRIFGSVNDMLKLGYTLK